MTKNANEKRSTNQEKLQTDQLQLLIGNHVMQHLGKPVAPYSVQVRPLWDDRYRVNVLTGVGTGSPCISHSFFLTADSDGNILTCNPEIRKAY